MTKLYFEQSWAILSTIGVGNVLYGLTVISITRFSSVALIPIIVSAACAIANGLCYYAFYAEDTPTVNAAVASGFADFFWLIQEVGISFYSYAILTRLLARRSRTVFMALFWVFVFGIAILRMLILVGRIKIILFPGSDFLRIVNYLHVGYFSLIALLECMSAFFLLREFASARRASKDAALSVGLLQHLMRGTETRVASLALIGISRAVAYIFNESLPQALTTPGQVDRFVYTLECMFPMMIYIDILACKIKFSDHSSMEMPHIGSLKSNEAIWDGIEDVNHHVVRRPPNTGNTAVRDLTGKSPTHGTNAWGNCGVIKTVEFSMYNDAASVSYGTSYNRTPSLK